MSRKVRAVLSGGAVVQSGSGSADPFLARIRAILDDAIAREWSERERLDTHARVHGWCAASRADYEAAAVCVENLARQLDNISVSKLRRELRKLGAPTPGDLIRETRISYACRLLIESRLLIREIAVRAGYDSEKHFAEQFQRVNGLTPSSYRRAHIERAVRHKRISKQPKENHHGEADEARVHRHHRREAP